MTKSIRATLCFLFLTAGIASADIVTVLNPDFTNTPIGCNSYAYQSADGCTTDSFPTQDFNSMAGFGWTLSTASSGMSSGDGLTNAGSPFNPPDFSALPNPASNAVFLQGAGPSVSQSLTTISGDTLTVNFYLGSRYATGSFDGNQTVEVLIDNNVVNTYNLTSSTPFTLESVTVAATPGAHTLEFMGTASGDHTAFVTDVTASTPDGGTTLALLGLAVAGLAGLRRKLSV
jgi:hypothetical protein